MLKRIKRLLRRRNNGGFTLVEVIVASALLGVLILGVFGFVQPVLRSVKQKEQNARAVMLAETIESYIVSSTKYAHYVQTFSGVATEDVLSSDGVTKAPIVSAAYTGTEFPANNGASLELMLNCLNTSTIVSPTDYEIRCIGMRWLPDPKTGEKKLMLTNEVVDQKTCAIDPTKTKLVFEPCFYDDLYPVLYFNNYNNQYKVVDKDTGALVDKYAPEDVEIAPAIEIKMDVYLDPACYSTNSAARANTGITFCGTSYAQFRNISSIYTYNVAKELKIQPNVEVNTYDDALTKARTAGEEYTNPEVGESYYPDTFIYYITKKVFMPTTTPPSPGT